MVLFLMLLKLISCNHLLNDIFARDQNHEKKHHLPLSTAAVFQVSCTTPENIPGTVTGQDLVLTRVTTKSKNNRTNTREVDCTGFNYPFAPLLIMNIGCFSAY